MKKSILVILSLFFLVSLEPSFALTTGFANPTNISGSADSQLPKAIISDKGIFVVWIETSSGKSDIFFSKSTDGGVTFESPVNLSGSTNGQSSSPVLAQKDNNVFVVWQSTLSGNSTIIFMKSSDGGTSFEKPIRISDPLKNSAFPQISVSENHVYFTWLEKSESGSTNVIVDKTDDQGNLFTAPMAITNNAGNAGLPKIFSEDNGVYLTWEDNSTKNYDIFLAKSTDYGNTFDSPVDISSNTGQSGTPQIVVSKNNVYAVWMDNTSGNYDIIFAKSTDGGKSFGNPVNVSQTGLDSGYPQLAISGDSVYVTWTETLSDNNYDVYFAKSTDAGTTFDKPINLSNNKGGSGWPQVAVDGDIYVSWVDATTGNYEILITKSSDGGVTFEKPVTMTDTKTESYYNTMEATANVVYMVWQVSDQGNHSILFTKSTTFVPEFGPYAMIALVASIVSILVISSRSKLKLPV